METHERSQDPVVEQSWLDADAASRPQTGASDRRRHRPLPILLTVDEAAALLRTTRRAIYAMIARRQLPGVVRVRRRVLLRSAGLLHWLEQKSAPSLEER
jgi:excisionase family DNA binding protein